MFCNVGLPSTSFSVYQPYIVALPGVGDTGGSLVIGMRTFVSMVCMVVVGKYFEALDCRRGCFLASILTVVSMLLFGFAKHLSSLLLAATFGGVAYGLGGMVGITLLVNRWYKSDVGTAIGLSTVGSGVASTVVPIVAERIISGVSLTAAFWAEGLLALVIAIVVGLLLRNRPEDMGLLPHMRPEDVAAVAEIEQLETRGMTESLTSEEIDDLTDGKGMRPVTGETPADSKEASEAAFADAGVELPKGVHRLFTFAMALLGGVTVAGGTFLSVLLVSQGYDHSFAAMILSIFGLSLLLSKVVTGKLYDVIGTVRGTAVSFVTELCGIALTCLTFTGSHALAIVGAILFGAGLANATVGLPIWSIDLSSVAGRARTIRVFQLGYTAGSFLFNLVPGVLMDLVGTYVISYVIMFVMALVTFVIIIAVYRRYYVRRPAIPQAG